MYSWLPQAIAADGYVAFIFDFPGQGRSDGLHPIHSVYFPRLNLYLRFGSFHEATLHYLNGDCVQATKDAITYLTTESPVASLVDSTRIGLIGHSLGGLVVTDTASQDPRVNAVVALSHATPSSVKNITVPLQLIGGAFDVTPASKSIPVLLHSYTNANAPKEVVFIAKGTHLGFTTALGPLCPCPEWQKPCCLNYVLGWFDWFLKGDPQAYAVITSGNEPLSMVLQSRFNFGAGDRVLHR
jgi:pimeloyl-ACP methyl ester carboxylesterase